MQLTSVLLRVISGIVASGIAAISARRLRALSTSGAIAATAVGTAAVAAGWCWAALLISYFIAATALSKLGEKDKGRRVGAIVEKGDERDATQVLANGSLYAMAAVAHAISHAPAWYALGIGALAASAADTWATEIGTLAGKEPVSIASGRRVPAGTSGGITLTGSLAGIGGALFIAAGAALAQWPVTFTAVVLGGMAGALSDSILGATLQSRRWCDACAKPTERMVHDCGNPTRRTGGMRGFDNDVVNAVCSGVGALVTLLLSR
ncbi:MAG: DUF92 domain-containing protein [Gemmatimonadaceae bacterium]